MNKTEVISLYHEFVLETGLSVEKVFAANFTGMVLADIVQEVPYLCVYIHADDFKPVVDKFELELTEGPQKAVMAMWKNKVILRQTKITIAPEMVTVVETVPLYDTVKSFYYNKKVSQEKASLLIGRIMNK